MSENTADEELCFCIKRLKLSVKTEGLPNTATCF